jgi:hypothetical protein
MICIFDSKDQVSAFWGRHGEQRQKGSRRPRIPTGSLTMSRTLCYTILVHNGGMRTANRVVRQSVSLPASVAAQVRSLAKARRLSANRIMLELIENGIEVERRKQQEFFDLAERFRSATDPKDVKRLGDEMGRMVFGN